MKKLKLKIRFNASKDVFEKYSDEAYLLYLTFPEDGDSINVIKSLLSKKFGTEVKNINGETFLGNRLRTRNCRSAHGLIQLFVCALLSWDLQNIRELVLLVAFPANCCWAIYFSCWSLTDHKLFAEQKLYTPDD